ncbi:CpaF/VirB11 family protein [Anaerorhabdus furcosa]|uniref:Pilus assembly protein CpaF n=1 Tax=Anaerorhabdus furcosa TaxID=118967 RepID=A0A1T4JVC8_9FIRM|nr:CpaF/VirB11 family protein [Anaerorhabdus furcosa]SJZ34182.1 pilus assembly protein CpaF [Anaerorhabdus furcosa]
MSDGNFNEIDFGLLQNLLEQEDITDVACKNGNEIWITSNDKGHYKSQMFISESEVERIANQIANKMQKEFNPANPSLEGDIQKDKLDYRVGCVHSYLSQEGTTLVIRKVRKKQFLTYDRLIQDKTISKKALDVLIYAVKGRANLLFIGETGSGKTELLKFLIPYIPKNEVIVTIEDSMEFNVKSIAPELSCTAFRIRKNYTYSTIISMALRLNVQRILLQEARGEEVRDLIDAISTGHTVMTTMHAKSAENVPSRIRQMIRDENENYDSLKKRIYALFDLVVHMEKIETKVGIKRTVKSIHEFYYDASNDECHLIEIYSNGRLINQLSNGLMTQIMKCIEELR